MWHSFLKVSRITPVSLGLEGGREMRQVETGQKQPPVPPSSEQNLGEMWICSLVEVSRVIFSGSGPTKQDLDTVAPTFLILCVCV